MDFFRKIDTSIKSKVCPSSEVRSFKSPIRDNASSWRAAAQIAFRSHYWPDHMAEASVRCELSFGGQRVINSDISCRVRVSPWCCNMVQ